MTRRGFLASAAAAAAPAAASAAPATAAPAAIAAGFFRAATCGGRWWLLDPAGRLFFTVGMNHIDSATLRVTSNGRLWQQRYANREELWLRKKVVPDLAAWGFNSVGWVQDVVIRGDVLHRHSRGWSLEQYEWLAMPYCHLLPFAEIHQWEQETRLPDFFSKYFEQWCDYVARDACTRMAGDRNLIGYFYSDCPTWVHTRPPNLKPPLFDPRKLESAAGRAELRALATRYYQVTHDAIRRYDPNHLILGDRYEARMPVPDEVLLAARPYVDVYSFQMFSPGSEVRSAFARFHELTGKPVLLADAAPRVRADTPKRSFAAEYAAVMEALRELKGAVGWHVCGAYLANRARTWGFLNEDESPNPYMVEPARRINRETAEWVRREQARGLPVTVAPLV